MEDNCKFHNNNRTIYNHNITSVSNHNYLPDDADYTIGSFYWLFSMRQVLVEN